MPDVEGAWEQAQSSHVYDGASAHMDVGINSEQGNQARVVVLQGALPASFSTLELYSQA